MARNEPHLVTFRLEGDKFEQAWFFNRFRCDWLGHSLLVTTALVSDVGGTPEVNGFVLSKTDLEGNRARSLGYLEKFPEYASEDVATKPLGMVTPNRIYPVNHLNLSRMDDVAEIGLFRYSIHTMLTKTKPTQKADKAKAAVGDLAVPCYPVVMFRCDVSVQLALIKDMYEAAS
jgi:hypothetical protein